MKNGKKLYNERGITFFHETETYVNDLNIYNRSKNGTSLWDDLIFPYIYFYLLPNFPSNFRRYDALYYGEI